MHSRCNVVLRDGRSLANGNTQHHRTARLDRHSAFVAPALVAVVIGSSGCSGSPASGTCNGNSVGGATGSDPCASGGNVATGGSQSSGGSTTVGGATSTVGTLSTGGAATTGGSESTGGGAMPTGGTESMGGATDTGGSESTGGTPATGGSAGTGGSGGTGGLPIAILQYKFEELSGTTAQDSTPNNNDGSLTSVTWSTSGRNGGSVSYAAADSTIAAPGGLLDGVHALTVSAWVNLTASAAESRLFYFGGTGTYLTLVLNNSSTPAGISLRFQGPTGAERVLTTATQLPLAVWKHVTVTVSSAGSAIYIDGKIVAQDKALAIDPSTLGTTTSALVGSSPTPGQALQGRLDEFYVYDGVQPLSEIRTLAWPKSDYSIYHFDEGSGTATADSSDRAINGTLVGAATWVPGPFGTAVYLNNTTTAPAQQYVDLADGVIANCGANSTFAGWINLVLNYPNARFLDFGNDDTHYVSMTTRYQSGTQDVSCLQFQFLYPTSRTVRATASWNLGQWYHIAAVRNATDTLGTNWIRLYVNGQMIGNGAISTGTIYGLTTGNYFGKSAIATNVGLNGSIDEIVVACRPYTDDEIKQLAYLPSP